MTTPPPEVLAGEPDRTDPRLSPDGRLVAYLAPRNGAMNLWVSPVDRPDERRQLTSYGGTGVRPTHGWSYDGRFVLFAIDEGGTELFHVCRADVSTGEVLDLTPFPGVHARVIAGSPRHPGRVLVAVNKDDPARLDYYVADLATGALELAETGRGYLAVFADGELRVRGGVRMTDEGGAVVEVDIAHERRPVLFVEPDDTIAFVMTPQPGMTVAGDAVHLMTSAQAETVRLLAVDVATGDVRVAAEDPEHDLEAVFVDAATRVPVAVAVAGPRRRWLAIDPDAQAGLDALSDPAYDVLDLSASLDGSCWLATLGSPSAPTSYRVLDRATGETRELFCDRPRLRDYSLGETEPFSFRSRDGLTIHGYLTFPPDRDRRDLPAVLYVHGGPWGRDGWWWDPSRQLLATRGYLCVQVNYRGSTGYGRGFVNAGDREWGGRMQDDLHDAVEHLVEQGCVDAGRVAIYGGSYGGYAALVGATFTPDAFRAAIAWVPPVNLVTLIRSFPPYWSAGLAMWKRRVGDPDTEPEFLLSRSPISRATDLRVPLLLVQGENDPRCPPTESQQLVDVLREQGIPHDYRVVAGEGHGFLRAENNVALLGWIEDFLAEHLVPLPDSTTAWAGSPAEA